LRHNDAASLTRSFTALYGKVMTSAVGVCLIN
jgi:hypothetical protein